MYLLGYLPINAFKDILDNDEQQHLKADLVHCAMEEMLLPLCMALEQGVQMWCPDGHLHHVFPHVDAYTANWPGQNLQCCTLQGGCLVCKTSNKDWGNFEEEAKLHQCEETLEVLWAYIITKNLHHLKLQKLKPVWPWWGDLPNVNLSTCITPGLLHQAYQGMFKAHLIWWMKKIISKDKLDNWYAAMPQAEGLVHYPNGISVVNSGMWTGCNSKQLFTQFLPMVIGPLDPNMRQMVCTLIDFMYCTQAPSLTESDLMAMDNNLHIFHQHKLLLIGLFYEDDGEDPFKAIAKLHMLQHWTHSICELGTLDGFNTGAPEHLHIEYAKVLW
ncbi:hypothetical protein OPQ81_002745 [Rhizoctonia solani]|nr:hypothetical protein OPQ81_002745 [Rhizoctonia solani]